MNRRFLFLLVASASAFALFAFGLSRDPSARPSALVGRQAPSFDLARLDSEGRISTRDLRGQIVVVNFWASWCTECIIEHPDLAAAWDRYRDAGVVFVGVAFEDDPSSSRGFMAERGGDWPIVEDPRAKTALAFGVYGIPETFFIDRSGEVVRRHAGPVTYDLMTEQIDEMLEETA
ncbi:MAG: TlpA family protein disulfide reductase [Actinomycetota bacterium]